MNQRIRTIKPEWRTDRRLNEAGIAARVLSVCLITMSDDHGRGHFREGVLAMECFEHEPDPSRTFREAFAKLSGWFLTTYEVRGERYWQIANWHSHQRVDKPRPSRLPAPSEADGSGEKPCDSGGREPIRETFANDSRNLREGLATGPGTVDHGSGTSDRRRVLDHTGGGDPVRPAPHDDERPGIERADKLAAAAMGAYQRAIESAKGIFQGGEKWRPDFVAVARAAVEVAGRTKTDPRAVLDAWAKRYVSERQKRRPDWWLEQVTTWAAEGTAPAIADEPTPYQRLLRKLDLAEQRGDWDAIDRIRAELNAMAGAA